MPNIGPLGVLFSRESLIFPQSNMWSLEKIVPQQSSRKFQEVLQSNSCFLQFNTSVRVQEREEVSKSDISFGWIAKPWEQLAHVESGGS